jgi:Bacterial archaeo-eukaryotic release factor family 11
MLHTDIPALTTIRHLATVREPFCVSIYLSTSPIPTEMEAARIELRNQLSDAVAQLRSGGADRERIASLEELVGEIIEDRVFWSYQSNTLVIFATSDNAQTFRVPNRLQSAVEVSDRLYIKPLMRTVTFPQTAFVLALSQNAVRLIELGADSDAYPVDVPELPRDAASSAGLASISGRSPEGRIQGSEGLKVRLRQYSRAIDAALRSVLNGLDVPLILATAEPLEGIYRSVNTYPHLAAETIPGNPDELSASELAVPARKILDQIYAAELDDLKERLSDRLAHGGAVTDLADIARAATFGAVDTLIVDIDSVVAGSIDEASGALTLSPTDGPSNYGVVDEIVRRSLVSGARIFAVRASDVPGGGPAAAITRFPV